MVLTMDDAATLVARCWRNRAKRRLLRMIPDVATLKAAFLDSEALAAGAEGSVLYTSGALKARALLQHAPPVKAALTEAWEALAPAGQTTMSRAEYFVMLRKVYRHRCRHRCRRAPAGLNINTPQVSLAVLLGSRLSPCPHAPPRVCARPLRCDLHQTPT
jgi:hypothetical protein